jgi:hypothetical protein
VCVTGARSIQILRLLLIFAGELGCEMDEVRPLVLMCLRVYVFICICVSVSLCLCSYVCVYVYVCMCVYVVMCLCVYVLLCRGRSVSQCLRVADTMQSRRERQAAILHNILSGMPRHDT